jgi:hypothetical protein
MDCRGGGVLFLGGKDALIVLDHVNNTLVHGLPDLERRWTDFLSAGPSRESDRLSPSAGSLEDLS